MRSLETAFLVGVDGVTEIWLVRHGDVYDGLTDPADPPLSAMGRDQAARLAKRVARRPPAAVYASPFRRAMETARALSDDVQVDPRLVEIPLTIDGAGSFEFTEKPDSVVARMNSAIEDIVSRHTGQRVVVVCHAGVIMACLSDVLGLEPGRLRMLPYYTSISVVRVLGERRMVGSVADTGHLE
jgi:probable phosphoglycerate mutase